MSTDKATAPSTLYGATKLCAERMFVDGNAYASTRFAVTRYGNVLGSRGSIIPAWKALLGTGAPLIVTDPSSTRFAMQMSEAVALVALAAETMVGGEVFIPSLPAFSLADLIEAMAPDGYPVEVSGLRPAEKRHELLISADEAPQARECLDGYRLLPLRDWRGVGTPGVAVAEGFRYGSDTARRLSVEELRGYCQPS